MPSRPVVNHPAGLNHSQGTGSGDLQVGLDGHFLFKHGLPSLRGALRVLQMATRGRQRGLNRLKGLLQFLGDAGYFPLLCFQSCHFPDLIWPPFTLGHVVNFPAELLVFKLTLVLGVTWDTKT